ncbi:Fe-S assembly protein IscX [Streptomyces cinnamoneus]|uniref:Fe-S assembly protein IscX n=1 Tax=Streptomyces cinnamoneus TaxID=53446 RepID=A0A2G1XKC2_STRCJ|nr:Fe-S cluster assembly protein IscX [Streptomyces cinnamoneus]PHQ51685.1 Fe-S assembly protein IscX [Streptomyces cinnamoneus]PPT11934.1 Fe-S assembly protein IscX [Streptomyces cinnamoneus]
MGWTDIEQIAAGLARKHPGTDPLAVTLTDVRDRVAALSGFTDDPTRCNARILESIQLAWSDRTT